MAAPSEEEANHLGDWVGQSGVCLGRVGDPAGQVWGQSRVDDVCPDARGSARQG